MSILPAELSRVTRPFVFHGFRRIIQSVLVVSLLVTAYGLFSEYSLRRYLTGFSNAVIPLTASPEGKVEAILSWMRSGPARLSGAPDDFMSNRDPRDTLNYAQLLNVCGTATNAFINLAMSGGLEARRLLLLAPDRGTKHVVAEVHIDSRWVVVDPTLRVFFRDSSGRTVTRAQLLDPVMLAEVTRNIPQYPAIYTYEKTAHVHLSSLPLIGRFLRTTLDHLIPQWEEAINWTLPLERKSFGLTILALSLAIFCLLTQLLMNWYARGRLGIETPGMAAHLRRFSKALFTNSH